MKVLLLLISCMTFLSVRSEEGASAEMHILDEHHQTDADDTIEEGDAPIQDGEALADIDSDESVMDDLLAQDTTDLDTQHFEKSDDSEEKAWYSALDAKQILKDILHFIDLHDDQDSALLDLKNPSFSDIEAALHVIHQKFLYNKIIYNDVAASADLQKADEYEGALQNIKKFTPDALTLLHKDLTQNQKNNNTVNDVEKQDQASEETHSVTYNQLEDESETDEQEEEPTAEEDTDSQDQEYEATEEDADQSEEELADEDAYELEESPEEEQEEYETEE